MQIADAKVVVQRQKVVAGLNRFANNITESISQLILQLIEKGMIVDDQATESE